MKIQVYILLILIVVSFSGCINPNGNDVNREIGSINTGNSLKVKRSQIKSINYTDVKPRLEMNNYSFKNDSEGDIYAYIASIKKTNKISPELKITIFSNNEKSIIKGSYYSENPIPHSELEEKKEYVKEKILEVAEICDLTVDIDQIEWVINYAD